MRPVLWYWEVLRFFNTLQSFDQITTLTYLLMDNFLSLFLLYTKLLGVTNKVKAKGNYSHRKLLFLLEKLRVCPSETTLYVVFNLAFKLYLTFIKVGKKEKIICYFITKHFCILVPTSFWHLICIKFLQWCRLCTVFGAIWDNLH